MLLFPFIKLTGNKANLVDFLIEHGVLPSSINCKKCGAILLINKHCCFDAEKGTSLKKKIKEFPNSATKKSSKVGTWFARSNLDIATICRIIASFLMLRPPRQEDLEEELCISSATVVDWFSFCREVIYIYYLYMYINVKY